MSKYWTYFVGASFFDFVCSLSSTTNCLKPTELNDWPKVFELNGWESWFCRTEKSFPQKTDTRVLWTQLSIWLRGNLWMCACEWGDWTLICIESIRLTLNERGAGSIPLPPFQSIFSHSLKSPLWWSILHTWMFRIAKNKCFPFRIPNHGYVPFLKCKIVQDFFLN